MNFDYLLNTKRARGATRAAREEERDAELYGRAPLPIPLYPAKRYDIVVRFVVRKVRARSAWCVRAFEALE